MQTGSVYETEERLRQRDRKRIDGKDTSKRVIPKPPGALIKNAQFLTTISPLDIQNILKKSYKNPVISLYLTFNAFTTTERPPTYQTIFNSMQIEECKKRKAYIDTLPHSPQKTLTEDITQIEEFLVNDLNIEGIKSLIIFKSGKDLQTVIQLPVHLTNKFVIDINPYISPLFRVLNKRSNYLTLQISQDIAKFYSSQFGQLQEIYKIDSNVPDPSVELARPAKVQRHRLDHRNRHFKKAADYIYKQFINHHFDYLIVIGNEHNTTDEFLNFLHPEAKKKLIHTSNLSPQEHGDKNILLKKIEEAIEPNETLREQDLIEIINQLDGKREMIKGLEQVIKAQNRGMIQHLYVAGTFSHKGYKCPDHPYLSLDKKDCALCNRELQEVENIVDELIEASYTHNASTHVFTAVPTLMSNYDNVAAALYTR